MKVFVAIPAGSSKERETPSTSGPPLLYLISAIQTKQRMAQWYKFGCVSKEEEKSFPVISSARHFDKIIIF